MGHSSYPALQSYGQLEVNTNGAGAGAGTGAGACCHSNKCDFSYLVIYDLVMFLITTAWLTVGTHFVSELSDRKNYATHRPNTDTCDFALFWFSYVVMILGWITVLLALVWLVNKYGRTLFNCITCNKYGY